MENLVGLKWPLYAEIMFFVPRDSVNKIYLTITKLQRGAI